MHERSTAVKKSQASSPGDPGLEMDNQKTEGEKLVIESRYGTIEVFTNDRATRQTTRG